MRERDLLKLELNKIKERLKELTHSLATEKKIDNLLPSTGEEEVRKNIELCKAFKEAQINLFRFDDISDLLKKSRIEGAYLSIDELLSILNFLKLVRELRKSVGRLAEAYPQVRVITKKLYNFSSLENLIEGSIDRRGFVKDEASEGLYRIRKSIKALEKEIMDRLENLLRRPDADKVFSDRIITLRNNRYVVPVKSSQVKKIFGIVHGTSSSGYTTYVEPQFVIELNNKLSELKSQEEEEVRKVLQRITSYVGDFSRKIEDSLEAVTEIDLIQAKLKLAELYNGTFPEIGSYVELRGTVHPLLKLSEREAVEIDIILKEKKGLLLTGPNTGGKTVALKTLGLVALMFQSAIPVPVREGSVLPVFKKIFTDIGDEQSIEQNLSTFSSHMTNIAEFLGEADEDTLVLLDELGAGTDPSEGSALGIGILEYLSRKGAWIFANTHHTPVKMYAINSDYFVPASVLFDRETLRPLYRIAYNTVGESMAFDVAQRCGIPQEVLQIAREHLSEGEESYRRAMERLARYTRDYEEKVLELERLKRELSETKKEYERLKEEYERAKAKDLKREVKRVLEQILKEGREVIERAKSYEEVRRFVEEKKKQLELFEEKEELKEGDWVEFFGKKGKIVKIKENKAFVSLGDKRLWVNLGALKKTEEPPAAETTLQTAPRPKTELNLLGKDANTALIELESFIEEAYSAGLKSVKVIHGIGRGVLKKVVHEFLEKSDKVRFFREAYPREGGSGVTVVFLEGDVR